jgi:hypothetical protein
MKTQVYQENIYYQYELKDAQILTLKNNAFWYFNQEGLTFMKLGECESTRRIDLESYEPFDEAFFLPTIKRLVLASFASNLIQLVILDLSETGTLSQEAVLELQVAHEIHALQSTNDCLFGFAEDVDNQQAFIYQIDLQSNPNWTATLTVLDWNLVEGMPLKLLGQSLLVTTEFRTPYPTRLRIFDPQGQSQAQLDTHTWAVQGEKLYYAAEHNGQSALGCFSQREGQQIIPVAGYLNYIHVDEENVIIQVYKDSRDIVYRLDRESDGFEFKAIWETTGRKIINRTSEGFLGVCVDFLTGISLVPYHNGYFDLDQTLSIGKWTEMDGTIWHERSPQGAEAIIYTPTETPKGTILHFHGGPDAHEVEDLRFFGAFRALAQEGFRIINLNYRGSIGLESHAYKAAMGSWHRTFPEDIQWLLDENWFSSDVPCIVAGWSFGATLAMLTAQALSFVRGIIGGGMMANLHTHRERAYAQDSLYESWFEERFGIHDPQAPCENYFILTGQIERQVSVLSFHGQEDPHCAYEDLQILRNHCLEQGSSWLHHDLASRGHYAEHLDDAYLIYEKTLVFVHEQCCTQ